MNVSTIVCTRNRGHKIYDCLTSIDESYNFARPINGEIIVVNNGSTDNTLEIVYAFAQKAMFPVRVLTEDKPGLNVARNCGLRNAVYEIIVYTDDDCRVSESYISDVLKHHTNDTEPVLRFGAVHLGDPQDWPISVNICPYTRRWQKFSGCSVYPRSSVIIGCNMTFPKSIVAKIGFFDERFGNKLIPGGDDTDFGFRAYEAGFALECVPDMVVKHFHGRNNIEVVSKLIKNYSIGGGALYAKLGFSHPHIKRKLQKVLGGSMEEMSQNNDLTQDERQVTIGNLFKKMQLLYFIGFVRFFYVTLIKTLKG